MEDKSTRGLRDLLIRAPSRGQRKGGTGWWRSTLLEKSFKMWATSWHICSIIFFLKKKESGYLIIQAAPSLA